MFKVGSTQKHTRHSTLEMSHVYAPSAGLLLSLPAPVKDLATLADLPAYAPDAAPVALEAPAAGWVWLAPTAAGPAARRAGASAGGGGASPVVRVSGTGFGGFAGVGRVAAAAGAAAAAPARAAAAAPAPASPAAADAPPPDAPGALPDGWVEAQDEEGDTYFFNGTTGESSWERPSAPAAPAAEADEPPARASGDIDETAVNAEGACDSFAPNQFKPNFCAKCRKKAELHRAAAE